MNIVTRGYGNGQQIITRGYGLELGVYLEPDMSFRPKIKEIKEFSWSIFAPIEINTEFEIPFNSTLEVSNDYLINCFASIYCETEFKIPISIKTNKSKIMEILEAL